MSNETKTRGLRILIVENHPDTVKWLQLFLEDMGHTAEPALNLAQARAALTAGEWDVLISDIGLPDGTGWDLLEKGHYKRPPFAIAMSGFGMNADNARSHSAGFRHHLLKPFKAVELEKLLDQAAQELELKE
jgi:CheY-like chemotaxis protein